MRVCTLASSSSGNSVLVSRGNTHILIDAGISLARIRKSLASLDLSPDDLSGVLVTHDHSDHIKGIEMLHKYHGTYVYATERVGRVVERVCRVIPERIVSIDRQNPFEVGEMGVTAFKTPHDATESVGYTIVSGGKKLFFATDLGCVTQEVMEAARGAELVVLEANHDVELLRCGPYPPHLKRRVLSDRGHLSNTVSGRFTAELVSGGARRVILAHLSKENNTPRLAYDTVCRFLEKAGVTASDGVSLSVAPHDEMSECYII